MIGEKLLHYEVTAQLGEGGMGVVYQATDTRLNREVAIKVLPAAFVEDAERLARFQREAQLLASLNHPNIGGIYGLEEEGAQRFLVLELIPGETLAERLARGAMPVAEALPIAQQIARALEAAHERGIVHRDLKPANIKLTPDGTVKVLDFGLAKAWDQPAGSDLTHSPTLTAQMTQAGVILGTASYMSPEQARGKTADKRADIFSFGVVLWEMLTGRKLFPGDTVSDVLAAVLRAEPDWGDLPPSLPRGAQRLLERCLVKDPNERLHDIADARIELDAALAEGPTSGRRGGREASSPRRWIRAAALGLVIAAAAAAGSLYLERRLGNEPAGSAAESRLRLDVHLGNLRMPSGVTAASYLALSPDGTQVAFSAYGPDSPLQLYVRSLDEIDAQRIEGTEGANCPFFSPDGQWIGFETDDKLKVVSREGGAVRALCDAPNMRGATWSPDGTIIFANGTGELRRVSDQGGDSALLFAPPPDSEIHLPRWPLLLPDGRHLLFTSLTTANVEQTRWTLHALSLDSGKERLLLSNAGAARLLPPDKLVFVRGGNDYRMAGNLRVVEIDPDEAEVVGEDREVLQGIQLGAGAATPYFDVGSHGELLYAPTDPSSPERRLAWVDLSGNIEPAFPDRGDFVDLRLSPDGRRAALAGREDIWVLDLERDTAARITSSGGSALPIWTPDGNRLIFERSDPEVGFLLYQVDAAGGEASPLTSAHSEFPNFVSPDGKRVSFSLQSSSAQWDIEELHLDEGGNVTPWLATPQLEMNARLSPDGRWVVYYSGNGTISVRRASGEGPAVTVSRQRGSEPTWSSDGQRIYFLSGGQMMAVDVATGEQFSAGSPHPLFTLPSALYRGGWRSYDVSPDGDRFLMVLGEAKEVDPLRLVYVPGWGRGIR